MLDGALFFGKSVKCRNRDKRDCPDSFYIYTNNFHFQHPLFNKTRIASIVHSSGFVFMIIYNNENTFKYALQHTVEHICCKYR